MNGDGTPDYGSCIAKKRNAQSYWFVTDVVGSMTQSKGTSQGTFFNTKDMTPLVDNEAFRKALDFLQESTKYGPPDELNLDVADTRPLFASRPLRAQPRLGRRRHDLASTRSTSKVIDKWGAAIMPGSKEVLELGHRQARRLHRDDLPLCHRRREPRALRGLRRLGRRHQRQGRCQGEGRGLRLLLLHDPAGAVERRRHDRQAPASTRTGPRSSPTSICWKKAGMSEAAAKVYLGAIKASSMNSPNMILDLRIPQNQKYQQVVLDEAISRFLAGEIDKEATVKAVDDGWNELNEEIGKDDQLKFYKATIGAK